MGEQCSGLQQAIAGDRPGIAKKVFKNLEKSSGRKDSNLRLSTLKAPVTQNATAPTINK